MKIRNKILSVLAAFFITLGFFNSFDFMSGECALSETRVYGDFEYRISTDINGIIITSYKGTDSDVAVPTVIDYYEVLEIGTKAFKGNETITNVVLPNSVTAIRGWAFDNCVNLKSINMPHDLKVIEKYAFNSCKALEDVKFCDNITSIGECAFQLCLSIKEFVIPGSIATVSEHSCNSLQNMETLVFKEGVKVIEKRSFINAYAIEDIYFPRTIEEIADYSVGFEYWSDWAEKYRPLDDVTIHGYSGTAAQVYAKKSGFKFVSLNPGEIPFGDVDSDGSVDSNDASMILAEYSRTSTGFDASFNAKQKSVADVDLDGQIDSSDASLVLSYYAYTSTGGKVSFEEFLSE